MEVTRQRLLLAFFSMMNYSVRQLLNYALLHQDFPLSDEQVQAYITRAMLVNLVWSLSGDSKWAGRRSLSEFVRGSTTIPLPADVQAPIVDYEVSRVKNVGAVSNKATLTQLTTNSDNILQSTKANCAAQFQVVIEGGDIDWQPWSRKVPRTEIESNRIAAGDVVVPTMDTVRHELLLNTWLSERKPLVLCGPPGSGKTMTLLSALR